MSAAKTVAIAVVAAAVAVAATLAQRSAETRLTARATGDTVPRYAGDSLIRPDGFERWVLAGASMGLGYSQPSGADAAGATGGMFHNVYIEPSAYEHYVRTGRFREGTMMAMTLFVPGQKVHPSKQGFFEGDFMALEVSLKDSARYPGSWAYFNFGMGAPASRAFALPRQACQSCHVQNAADDNVFVQFYPTLRAVSSKFDRDKTLGAKTSSAGATARNGLFPNFVDATPSRQTVHVRRLLAEPATLWVPGHGAGARAAELRAFLTLLESIEDGARRAIARGVPAAEGARGWRPPGALGEWVRFSDDYYEVAFRAWEKELRS